MKSKSSLHSFGGDNRKFLEGIVTSLQEKFPYFINAVKDGDDIYVSFGKKFYPMKSLDELSKEADDAAKREYFKSLFTAIRESFEKIPEITEDKSKD